GASMTEDGIKVTPAEGPGTTAGPRTTNIAPPYAVEVSPASQSGAARAGHSVSYQLTSRNLGFNADSFGVAASGTYLATVFASDCSTPLSTTSSLSPGATTDVCVTVDVPGSAAQGDTSTTTV